jgi:phospholipid-binding lipoprotein MlaA
MKRLLPVLAAAAFTVGCASVPEGEGVEYDPWERLNRGIYRFNDAADRAITRPIARGYAAVLPAPVRQGVTNFSRNLLTPLYSVNNFLQGKPKEGTGELFRLAINSTVGIGGILDVAAMNGIESNPEDFGQTAAVWGVPAGPYVVVPFLGPQTLRDAVLLPVDLQLDPLYHYRVSSVRDRLYVLRLINLRANLLPLEDLLKDSADPYVTMRESFLQNREFAIYDGNPPSDDDDEFFDEFLEDEDY